jgi:hypothetical protein
MVKLDKLCLLLYYKLYLGEACKNLQTLPGTPVSAVTQLVRFVLFLAGFLFKTSFFSESKLCTRPLFSHFCNKSGSVGGPTNPLNSSVGSILWERIVWIYNLKVTIVSQKYQELSLQVEISE